MATPMKHAASQQGKTPSQLAAATPPVSTPFSQTQPAFSPRGPRSSPQQFKKSPAATSTTIKGDLGSVPLTFDSPSAAAAMGALGMGGGLDIGLDNVAVGTAGLSLGGVSLEEEMVKTLDSCIAILDVGVARNIGLGAMLTTTETQRSCQRNRTRAVSRAHGLELSSRG